MPSAVYNSSSEDTTPVWGVAKIANYLTDGYWRWNDDNANDGERSFQVGSGGTVTYNVTGLTAAEKVLAVNALSAWSIATGLKFVASTASDADIIFSDSGNSAKGGQNKFWPDSGEIVQSFVTIGSGWADRYGTQLDDYTFKSYIHEIGHALGLGHAGPYNSSAVYGTDNIYANDSVLMSVMSYFTPVENDYYGGKDVSVITPMIADYSAMRALYGATAAYAGNTVWGANSNVGGYLDKIFSYVYDGVTADSSLYSGGRIAYTVYDTAGYDTLNFSTVKAAQTIDMRAGQLSTVGDDGDRMGIAIGTVVEKAIGGAGADSITGNAAGNLILGGAGNDTLSGLYGNDAINGQAGADVVYGAVGADTLYGAMGNDRLFGGNGADVLSGGAGNDRLDGGAHNDRLTGEAGADTLAGGAGADSLFGGAGADVLAGGAGADKLTGGAGADVFVFASHAKGERDVVVDFQDGVDKISMGGVSGGYDAISISQSTVNGADAALVSYAGHSIYLANVSASAINVDDFIIS